MATTMEPNRERYDELCRLCASYDAVKMDIFGQEGKNRQLVTKIQTCLPFKIAEDDRLPKCLCYRCMYNLENFYDFRTACVNAVALLERCLPTDEIKMEMKAEDCGEVEVACDGGEAYSELRNELLKDKDNLPMMIPEATVVNPNAALGTPPRHNSGHDLDPDEAVDHNSCPPDDNLDERDPDEYEMDMETNPSDFLEMSAMVAEEESHQLPQPSSYPQQSSQRTGEQHEVYVCSLCNKAFSSKGHLSLHARIHVGAGDVIGEKVVTDDNTSYKRPYQCDLCSKAYSTAKHRWGHVSTSHRGHPAVTCGYCSRIYSTRMNLEEHVKSKHAGQPPPPELPVPYSQADNRLQCKTCPKMYASVSDLNKHSRTCEQQQQQRREAAATNNNFHNKFGKGKSDPTSDMSSLDSDSENKDYKSAQAKLAKNPQLTILKQALIKGDSVKREYEERQKMLSNAKKQSNTVNKDGSTDAKRWYCEVCPVNFATMEELRQHSKTHDADKPFICILCEKDFVVKSSLSRHILTSHGVDPTPLIESDKCLKKSVIESGMQTSLIKEELNLPKDELGSPYSDTMDNDEDERENGTENMLEMETVFVCEICTRDFNDRASLWLHIRATHKEFAAFACGVCLKICQDNEQLSNHVNMYHGGSKLAISEQRRYSCTICGRQHDSRKKLITHVSIHNVDPAYDPANFVQLNTNYFEPSESNDLVMDCDDESDKVDCYICYKSFPSEDHLIRHQRNAHKNEPMVQASGEYGNGAGQNGNGSRAQYHLFFVCELCGSSHPSKWERWLHVSSIHCDEPSIRCERDDCEKIFSTKNLRNDHAQHHQLQGSSPNTCEICGKLWGSRVDYWKHMMGVHADTVPLICGVCLKIFPDVMQLSQHVKLKHWPLTNGDFSCDICGRPYSNKSKMSRHRKIHGLDGEAFNPAATNTSLVIHDALNEAPGLPVPPMHMDNGLPQPVESAPVDLSCEMCGDLKFPSLEELSNHRRVVHSMYPCDLCNKCYGRTSHLWKHVNRVHKGHADITCRYCLKTSASRDHLAAHIAKIHRYEPEVKNDLRDAMAYKTNVSMNQGYSMAMVPPATPDSEEDGLHFCEKCNKSFHKRYLLRRHMKGCQNYRKDPGALLTRCRACERIFKDRASLQKHIENHHSSYECHLCKETVTSKLGIMTHNRMHHMHHPDLTCELESCRKLFRTKEDLESHRKDHKHHGTPNVCDFCGDTVENKLKLKMHILSLHRNEIGVSCGVCLIPMKDPKDLKKHVEDVHNHVLDKPNTCQVCGKQYASKWKAFDHTKKCHGKVFRTCKQCLAVFTTDPDLRSHYEHVHNVPKDQLDAYQYRLEVACKSMEDYDLGSLEVVVKEEPEEIDFDLDPFDEEESNDSKRPRSVSDTFDCEICPEIFLNHELLSQHYRNVHNTDPARMFKRLKLDQQQQQQQGAIGSSSNDATSTPSGKSSKKTRERENYECSNCQKQFCNKMLYLQHADVCTRKTTSILEAHLKSGSNSSGSKQSSQSQAQSVKREESAPPTPSPQSESMMCEPNLNIPDFNLFEDINMQLSGQKPPVPSLMPLAPHSAGSKNASSSKYSRKDSRKVYDESTNTECSCEVCGKHWPAKKHLWQHLIRFHRAEAAVTCGVCLKLCVTYEDLADHLKAAHPAILSTVGNNFTCKICGRYHNARSKLLLHMSIHINCTTNNSCQRCDSVFENEDKLKEHLATCTGSKDPAGANSSTVDGEQQLQQHQDGVVKQENVEGNEGDDDDDDDSDDDSDSSSSSGSNSSSNSSSDDSDGSSGSGSGSGSDDDEDDDNSSKDSDAMAQQQRQIQQQQQEQQQRQQRMIKSEMMLGTENLALSEEDDDDDEDEKPRYEPALSESEDDAYLKKKHAPQPMLSRYSDDDGPPKLYPMMPRPSSDKNDDSQEELASSARRNDSDDDSCDERHDPNRDGVQTNEVVVGHGVGLHSHHGRGGDQGVEQQIEDEGIHEMEHEVGGDQHLGHEEEVGEEQDHDMQQVDEDDEQNVEHDMNDEMLEVDENDMHNLNGTVLMLANDEDGNQILIERNVADLENDDSVHDMAQYVFQDGEGFALEDYEAIVAGQGDEDDEGHRAYQMDIGSHGEQIQEEEIGGEQEIEGNVGDMDGVDVEQEHHVKEEMVEEAEDDFSAKS